MHEILIYELMNHTPTVGMNALEQNAALCTTSAIDSKRPAEMVVGRNGQPTATHKWTASRGIHFHRHQYTVDVVAVVVVVFLCSDSILN